MTTQPWNAEYELSETDARQMIEDQFPSFTPAHLEVLGVGWDNTAWLVNDEFVFRFPRRSIGAQTLDAEIQVLPGLAGRLPLPVSAPEFVGHPAGGFPWKFAGYRKLRGRTACLANLSDAQRHDAARVLGEFLAALHAGGPDEAARLGAEPDRMGRLDAERRVPQVRQTLARLKEWNRVEDLAPFEGIIEDAAVRPPQATTVVHGDLYSRHLLVDDADRLCGVIDWGDVHFGDVAVDLAIAHEFLPASARGAFRRAYGPIDEGTWRLARFRALVHGALVAGYAHEIDDANLLREGLLSLRYVREDE